MIIIVKPGALNLSGNLSKFLISASAKFNFILKKGTTVLLEQVYNPGTSGEVTIDVHEIIEASLNYDLRNTSAIYEQTGIVATFSAIIDETETVEFKVIRAGVANFADTAVNFLTANFLTWQPQVKKVTYYSPEFLTYYAANESIIKLEAHYEDKSTESIEIGTLTAGKAYTIPCQYATINNLLTKKLPLYYDIFISSPQNDRYSYIQRFVASNKLSEDEEWILFENSLGGCDVFRAYGSDQLEAGHNHKIAEIDEVSQEFRVDTDRKHKKNTGHLDNYERRWLLDFFPSTKKYIYEDAAIRKITVIESDVNYNSKELPSNYNFTYKFSEAKPYLSLSRAAVLPSEVTLSFPDIGSFTLPPRLIEFPHITLSEGALIPAQDPYSENLGVVTLATLAAYLISTGEFAELKELIKTIDLKYLSKTKNDTAAGLIRFLQGLEVGSYEPGAAGGIFKKINDDTVIEADKLVIRKRAIFKELIIQQLSHVDGEQINSPARMECIKVQPNPSYYRCFFDTGDNGEVINKFVVGDQARCQVFTGSKLKYYWRLVIGVGTDYIDLSVSDCDDNSDAPAAGDKISQLGNRTDADRQGAIILSSFGIDAPSIKQYSGINSYSLEGKSITVFSKSGNKIEGILHIAAGSSGWKNLEGLQDEFDGIAVGSTNILLNSGFTGNYESADLSDLNLDDNESLYSDNFKNWQHENATTQEDPESKSGFSVLSQGGYISQKVKLIAGEKYVLSFRAKGDFIIMEAPGLGETYLLLDRYMRSVVNFDAIEGEELKLSGDFTICEIQLERGTIATDWSIAYEDNDASTTKFKALEYILSTIKNGSIDQLGGLILANMIQLGNYEDGVMKNVTAGISGIYNDETDPVLWGGGTLEQAIKALINPADPKSAKFAVSHSGKVILLDAFIRGILSSADGKNYLDMQSVSMNFENDVKTKEFSINKNNNGQIRTKGLTIVSLDGQTESVLPCFRGPYDENTEYIDGDETTDENESWRCLSKIKIKGIKPSEGPNWTKLAGKGSDADIATISGDKIFVYPKNTSSATPQSISLLCNLSKNLTLYQWAFKNATNEWQNFTTAQGGENNTFSIYPDGSTGSGAATINWNDIWFGRKSLSIRCLSGSVYDIVNIVKVYDGDDSLAVNLTNDNHSLPADSDGVVGDYSGSGTEIRVYEGATQLEFVESYPTAGQYTIQPYVYPEGKLTVGAINGKLTQVATVGNHSAMDDLTDKVSIRYSINGYNSRGVDFSLNPIQSILKIKEGASAYNVEIDNQNIHVDYDQNYILGNKIISIKVLKGSNYLEYGSAKNKFSVSIEAVKISGHSASNTTDSFIIDLGEAAFDSLTTFNAIIKVSISVNGLTIKKNVEVIRNNNAVTACMGDYDPTKEYTGNALKRHWVIYNSQNYITKMSAGTIAAGSVLPTDTNYWEPFTEMDNVATKLLLALNAYIKILSGNDIRVMDSLDPEKIVATLTGSGLFPLFLGAGTAELSNFKVDKSGKMSSTGATVEGEFWANFEGNRIHIDPENRRIEFLDTNNNLVLDLSFDDNAEGRIQLYSYEGGTLSFITYVDGRQFKITDLTNKEDVIRIKAQKLSEGFNDFSFAGLPAAPSIANNLWIDGNIIKLGASVNTNARHLRGKEDDPPMITKGSALGQNASVSIAGTDLAGRFTMVAGAVPTPGQLCTVTFNTPYDQAPFVTITAANQNAANSISTIWIESTFSGFTVHCDVDVDPYFEFNYNFIVIQ